MELVIALEQLRSAAGNRPIHILSGARCWDHNRRVGGSPLSRHLASLEDGVERIADAADVVCPGVTVRELYRAAETVPRFLRGGVGVYPTHGFVHVDTRPHRSRWAVLRRGGPQVPIPEGYLQ